MRREMPASSSPAAGLGSAGKEKKVLTWALVAKGLLDDLHEDLLPGFTTS